MTNIENLEQEIKKILKEFKQEINLLNEDLRNEFHEKIISIISKNPEEKELIEFIIYINDRLEDTFDKKMDLLINYIIKILDLKKNHIYITKEIKEKVENKVQKKIINGLNILFSNKFFITFIIILLIIVIYFIDKDFAKELIHSKLF